MGDWPCLGRSPNGLSVLPLVFFAITTPAELVQCLIRSLEPARWLIKLLDGRFNQHYAEPLELIEVSPVCQQDDPDTGVLRQRIIAE